MAERRISGALRLLAPGDGTSGDASGVCLMHVHRRPDYSTLAELNPGGSVARVARSG